MEKYVRRLYHIRHQEITAGVFNERLNLQHRVNLVRIMLDMLEELNPSYLDEVYNCFLEESTADEWRPQWEIERCEFYDEIFSNEGRFLILKKKLGK
jgi:hypothetical protein